ncbi:MAG: SH3 domain-containing protein [Deltaproteobacteria bacterium]|nr:SH3 domain-containing protein [Deltaproteobacteria bacterium]
MEAVRFPSSGGICRIRRNRSLPWWLLVAVLALLCCGPAAAAAPRPRAVIRVRKANVRKAPDKHSRRLFSLRRKASITILREQGDWYYIVDKRGRKGWLFGSLCRLVRPRKQPPEIEFLSNGLNRSQEKFFLGLVGYLRKKLAAPQRRRLVFEVSRLEHEKGVAASGKGERVSWLLLLQVPFSRASYAELRDRKLETGVIDLLPYQAFLGALLDCRDRLLTEMEKDRELWPSVRNGLSPVEVMVLLKGENGDQVGIGGFRKHGLPVFNDFIVLQIHGFRRFSLAATIPANVTDFNLFTLPSPFLPDGSRSPAALAYDFFGLAY